MGLLDNYLHGDHPGESDKRGVIPATQQQVRGLLESAANPAMREIAGGLISNIALKKNEQQAKPSFYNPGNVEYGADWTGALPGIGYQHGEVVKGGRHAIFNSPVLGLRALFRDVKTKMGRHGGDISKIIKQYAPPSDNPTKKYIEFVREQLKLKKGEDKIADEKIPDLVKAIIRFENDRQDLIDLYLSDEVFNEAKRLSKHSLTGGGDLAAAQAEHDIKESQ